MAVNVDSSYSSPYTLQFKTPAELLTRGFQTSPWNDPKLQGDIPYAQWYDATRYSPGDLSWGPGAAQYPAAEVPTGVDAMLWKRERVLAAASTLIGTAYQHHHIPAWDPPASWKWDAVSLGRNSTGIDCSDFTSFCYNYALGLRLPTATSDQPEMDRNPPKGPGGQGTWKVQRVSLPSTDVGTLVETLQPADLLYIRGNKDPGSPITHVVMWVGLAIVSYAGGAAVEPLVIDSHDNKPPVKDGLGITIPAGVNLRPFRAQEYYSDCFDHALRLVF